MWSCVGIVQLFSQAAGTLTQCSLHSSIPCEEVGYTTSWQVVQICTLAEPPSSADWVVCLCAAGVPGVPDCCWSVVHCCCKAATATEGAGATVGEMGVRLCTGLSNVFCG